MRATANESNPSTCGKCWFGKCQVLVNKTMSTPWNIYSICTLVSSLFTPPPCMFHDTMHRSLWSPHPYIEEGEQIQMSLMKNSTARQKARLPVALASLNNGHKSNLRACCANVRSSSRPNFVRLTPSKHGPAVLARCKLEQHCAWAHSCHRSGGPHSCKPLPHGNNDLGT